VSALTKEDWMSDSLLEDAALATIRLCHLYEYTREVTIWTENSISLGQHAMLLVHPELVSPLFSFCITKPGCSRDWLRVPYFKLASSIRDDLLKLYDSHLGAWIDPSHPLHEMPFLPVGSGSPFATIDEGSTKGPLRLDISPVGSKQFARECFAAFLRSKFGSEEDKHDQGGKAEIRQLKNHLRYLGALRLLRHMSAREAIRLTMRVLGRPLYAHPSRWSRAKREATKIIESFDVELRPIKALFAHAPENITSVQYDSAAGRLTYS
jgi:hypothetical protein